MLLGATIMMIIKLPFAIRADEVDVLIRDYARLLIACYHLPDRSAEIVKRLVELQELSETFRDMAAREAARVEAEGQRWTIPTEPDGSPAGTNGVKGTVLK